MKHSVVCALTLLLAAGAAFADPPATVTEKLADAAIAAVAEGDDEALRTITQHPSADPWLVVDTTFARGSAEAARTLAALYTGPRVEQIAAYAKGYEETEALAKLRQASLDLSRALDARDGPAVQRLANLRPKLGRDMPSVMYGRVFAIYLLRTNQLEAAMVQGEAAGMRAEKIGWLVGAVLAYTDAGLAAARRGQYSRARDIWQKKLRLARAAKLPRATAKALGNLGTVAIRQGAWAEAERLLRAALAAYEKLGNRESVATQIGNLGVLYRETNQLDKALEMQNRALEMMREVGDRAGAMRTLSNIAILYSEKGEHDRALETQLIALKQAEELGSKRHISRILTIVSGHRRRRGELRESMRVLERALKVSRESGDRQSEAYATGMLAGVVERTGDYTRAAQLLRKTTAMLRKTGAYPQIAQHLTQLAIVLYRMGKFGEAHRTIDEALALHRKVNIPSATAHARNALGLLFYAMGDDERALAELRGALKIAQGGAPVGLRLHYRNNIARVLIAMHRFEEAAALVEESIGIAEQANADASLRGLREQQARLLVAERKFESAIEIYQALLAGADQVELGDVTAMRCDLGNALEGAKRYDEAVPVLEQAIKEAQELGSLLLHVQALANLGEVERARGNPDRVLELAREAHTELLLSAGEQSDELGARTRNVHGRIYGMALDAAYALQKADVAYWALESGRIAGLVSTLGDSRKRLVPEDLRTNEAEARGALANAQAAYDAARKGGKRKARREARKVVDAARESLRVAVEQIQRHRQQGGPSIFSEARPLPEVRSRIDADEAVVLYGSGIDHYYAMVVTRDRVRIIRLETRRAIHRAVTALLSDEEKHVSPDEAPAIAKLLVAPLALGEGIRRVEISPVGEIGLVPLALVMPDHELTYVPSITIHDELAQSPRKPATGVLALGDPVYEGTKLARLTSSAAEAKRVGSKTLLRADANATSLRDSLAAQTSWRALHIACHALVDPEHPASSALVLSSVPGAGPYLSVSDIYALDVPADLVVLSACETARGKTLIAESTLGLPRAFLHAGARAVISSLWKVDDGATGALMAKFYELWNPAKGKGLSAAAALKQAQAHVRAQAKWAHPYYWSAWVLVGSPD